MIRALLIGIWGCVVAVAASYAAATWQAGAAVPVIDAVAGKNEIHEGLEYRKPPAITVPMISDGRLRGYVVAKLVYIADAAALHAFPIDPQAFVLDEAFRRIYTDGKVEFDQISKYNLNEITQAILKNVNERLGADLIHDVLIEEVQYVDKGSLKPAESAEQPE
jgi:hypothetical protein